jgi:hypothetical protein
MYEQLLFPGLLLDQYACFYQLFQIIRDTLLLCDALVYQLADAATGLREDGWHQFVALDFRQRGLYVLAGMFFQVAQGAYLDDGPEGCLFNSFQDVNNPVLPGLVAGHCLQQAVEVCLVGR